MDLDTRRITFSRPNNPVGAVLVGALALALLAGCTGQKVKGNSGKESTEIRIGDFRGDPNQPSPVVADSNLPSTTDQTSIPAQSETIGSDPGTPVSPPVLPTTGSPSRTAIVSGEDGLEFIDAKVGDISGHPIYVSSFFEPIKDRLIAAGQEKELGPWRSEAIEIVKSRLDGIIYDELLRAETIAALTPQQRVGLQSFLSDFRSNLLSKNLGSKELANRRLLEEQGITLDQALRQQELDTLVGLTLYQEINRRINISWRDIKQRYQRDIDKYQPNPTVVLQVIRVLEPEGELVDSITNRLNDGEPFADIASSELNTFERDTQGTMRVGLVEDFGETKFFGIEILNQAVWDLDEGEWTGPVSLGNANFWIMYVDREQESRTLYEAQLEIFRELTIERRETERAEFLEDLIERARVSSRDEILLRLLYIAENNYGPAQ